MEQALTKQQILSELTRSSHSALNDYLPVGLAASAQEPEFMAHLVAWDAAKGQVRDAHIALPLVTLACASFRDEEFVENSLAHLAKLTPRELHTAYKFAQGFIRNKDIVEKEIRSKAAAEGQPMRIRKVKARVGGWKRFGSGLLGSVGRKNMLDRLVARYLRNRESNPAAFERNLIQFRRDIISLYGVTHTPMSDYAKSIIIDKQYPADSALAAVRDLYRMSPREAAAAIVAHRLPFLSLFSSLKEKVKDPVLLMAIIDRMSPSELQTNIKLLEKMGVNAHPETRAALESSLSRLATSRKTTLKTAKAAETIQDQALKTKLAEVQEKQISNIKGLDGNWLVLADASGSMGAAVEIAKLIAGTLARFVKNEIALVFFNNTPRYFDVTGKTLEEIRHLTRHVTAIGGTSIGCGVRAAREKGFDVQGIVVVSDGDENAAPLFADQYRALVQALNRDIPVYYYKVGGTSYSFRYAGSGPAAVSDSFIISMQQAGYDMEVRDLRSVKVDDYSIPNMVQTMRVNRYSVLDEILETRLLTVDRVLGIEKEVLVCS